MLAPSFNIQIDWIGGGTTVGKYSHQFRIHILGIQGAYSFPVSVPLVPFSSSSSIGSVASGSSIDGNTWYSNTADNDIFTLFFFSIIPIQKRKKC